jgi:hypothetical protein
MLRLVSILLSQPLEIWKKSNQGGLRIQLRGSNCWVKSPLSLFDTTIFLESGLEELFTIKTTTRNSQ